MNPVIESNREELANLCHKYSVSRFELFGSSTEERFDTGQSDLDFLVEFHTLPPKAHADAYFGLLESLQDLFNRRIDLVETNAIRNPYFITSINQNRVLLYAA